METKQSEPDKIKRIKRLESKVRELELIQQLVVEKKVFTNREMVDKEIQTEELQEEKELEKLWAENKKLKTDNKDLEERITRLEKMERIISAHIQNFPK